MNNAWQPLDTAPKDGTQILARYPKQGNVKKLVSWNNLHNFWQSNGEPIAGFAYQGVEWHPLPPDDGSASKDEQIRKLREALERISAIDPRDVNQYAKGWVDHCQQVARAALKETE